MLASLGSEVGVPPAEDLGTDHQAPLGRAAVLVQSGADADLQTETSARSDPFEARRHEGFDARISSCA